ncbi:hypothetical protein HYX58_03995 [Candidatus Dependentiae bacterium]|nr:hypothetical protein [Candidatus Dependentiae bacterium]
MTIWRENYFVCIFIVVVYLLSIILNVLLQESKLGNGHSISHYEYAQFLGSWRLMASDFYWFQFLQKDFARCGANEIVNGMMLMKKLDPHFTSAFRLAAMSLLTYHKKPLEALDLIANALTSEVNRTDWRLYGYSLIAKNMLTIQEKSKHFFKYERVLAAPKLLALEIPPIPNYLLRKLEA